VPIFPIGTLEAMSLAQSGTASKHVTAQLRKYNCESSAVPVLSLCRPHCADTGLQSVKLETTETF
jgi:hypothetical protein